MKSLYEENELSHKKVFDGKCINVMTYDVELSNGQKSYREVVHHPGGVVAVAQIEEGKLLMVKQYRFSIKQESIELPAGRLEIGEKPEDAVKRELEEETGFNANNWQSLGYIYSSPGIFDEKLFLYYASDLLYNKQHPDDNEIVDFFEYNLDDVLQMIDDGLIWDSKTICGIYKAIRNGFLK